MKKFNTINDVAEALNIYPSYEGASYTVLDIVENLVGLANEKNVHKEHDEYLGLLTDFDDNFLKTSLKDADNQKFKEENDRIVEQANIIFKILNKRS